MASEGTRREAGGGPFKPRTGPPAFRAGELGAGVALRSLRHRRCGVWDCEGTAAYRVGVASCGKKETVEISDTAPKGVQMSMPSPTRRNGAGSKRPLDEMRQQARIIANFAEYLTEDIRNHPERAREATRALAEWCKADLELLVHKRHRGRAPSARRTAGDHGEQPLRHPVAPHRQRGLARQGLPPHNRTPRRSKTAEYA